MSFDTLVVERMTESCNSRKIEIAPFSGVASKFKTWETRIGAVARKNNDIVWPLQEDESAKAGTETPPTQVPQANARRTEWGSKNGAVFGIVMFSARYAAKALGHQYCSRELDTGNGRDAYLSSA